MSSTCDEIREEEKFRVKFWNRDTEQNKNGETSEEIESSFLSKLESESTYG